MSSGIVEQKQQQGSTIQDRQGAGGEQQQAAGSRHQLVQRLLDSSSNLPAFINDLLTTQAVTVAGTEAAGFLLEKTGEENKVGLRPIAHIRPDSSNAETRAAALAAFQDLIKPCIQQSRDGAIEISAGSDGTESQFCLVTLLRSEGEIVAASAVITRCINVERARQRLMSMQLVAGYFELFQLRKNADHARNIAASHQHVLQLATSVATAEGFESAAMNLCNELATRAGATRVALGWVKGKNIKLKALSHTEQFDKKQELVVALERVMEECMDQEEIVQFDPTGKGSENVTRNAQALSRSQGGHIVLSLPLRRKADVIGVVTLEFLPNQKVTPQVANGLAIAVDLLAPQLYDRYQNDRYLITKAGISTRETAKMVVGPKHMLAKLIAVLLIGLIAVSILYKPMYRVSAPFQFVTTERYTLSAPWEGELTRLAIVTPDGQVLDPDARVTLEPGDRRLKPGDKVKQGQVLVRMRTTELENERLRAFIEANNKRLEAGRFRAEDKIAEAEIAEAEAKSADAKVKILEQQIDQASIKAPIDGVVLIGDLTDRQGQRVKMGDALFEIGQPDQLKVELQVAERDIQHVKEGSVGKVATTSLPDDEYEIKIERIVPMGVAKEGDNAFKVVGVITGNKSPTWRPGMAGEARIDVRPEPLYWIYTHKLFDWLKLKLWM